MDKKQLIELLNKYEAGACTDQERALLETWYLTWKPVPSPPLTDKLAEDSVDRIWERLQETVRKPEKRRFRLVYRLAATAACLALIAFFSFWWNRNRFKFPPAVALVSVSAHDGPHKTILPDSSIIWLRHGASLEYPARFGRSRQVSLRGAALFEVAKDPEHPFVVSVGDYTATALGTSFYITQSSNRSDMEVVVLTGSVAVEARENSSLPEKLVLQPDQKVSTRNPGEIIPVSENESLAYTSGTAYDMNFENMPFDKVLARIEQKFDVTVEVQKERYASCRFTADLTDQGLVYTLKFIAASAGAYFEIKEQTVFIKGGGCN